MTDNTKKDGLGWKMWIGIGASFFYAGGAVFISVCYTHIRAHET
jgi:hypothetical protein